MIPRETGVGRRGASGRIGTRQAGRGTERRT